MSVFNHGCQKHLNYSYLFFCNSDISILYNVLQEDTISINHNWLNGCNVDIMWQFLQNELLSVQKEISEWRNTMDSWHQHCQVLVISLLTVGI